MAASFKDLKNSRGGFEKLREQVKNLGSKNYEKDETYWQPTVDKAGNGFAVIRFLPAPPNEDLAFVQLYSHGFKNPKNGRWYIQNSRTTIGEADPVSDLNTQLWNNGTEAGKAQARNQKRKLHFISNILVVKDPANPENEGKVFRFKYGRKIFDKINDKLNPQYEGDEGFNPFDPWEGADFKLKIRKVDDQRNYDNSEFAQQSEIGTDEEIEEIWKRQYSLAEIIAPSNFKSYEELKKNLDFVLSGSSPAKKLDEDEDNDDSGPTEEEDTITQRSKPTQPAKSVRQSSKPAAVTDEDDEDLSYFQNLADDED